MQAAASKILTRRSSNCSKMSFQRGLPSSAGSSIEKNTYIEIWYVYAYLLLIYR